MISIKFFFRNKKYFASAFLYSCFSLIFSTWVTYIPHIAEKIGITEGRIGKAIFFIALNRQDRCRQVHILCIADILYLLFRAISGIQLCFTLYQPVHLRSGRFIIWNFIKLPDCNHRTRGRSVHYVGKSWILEPGWHDWLCNWKLHCCISS